MKYDIVALFCCIDDFCRLYEALVSHRLIEMDRKRHRATVMTLAEMLVIMVMFQVSGYKNFKNYYNGYLRLVHKQDFPTLISYERFVQLIPRLLLPFAIMLHALFGEKTGHYIVDSTALKVCHLRRTTRHKVFAGLARKGKTSMGWFYGLKLHMIINQKGEIVAVQITRGNVHDISTIKGLAHGLVGKIFGDKAYLSQKLFEQLYVKGLRIITGIRRNMRNILLPLEDKIHLRKRYLIETVFGQLKEQYTLWHTRHRSIVNALTHLMACLCAYQLAPLFMAQHTGVKQKISKIPPQIC